MSDTRFISFYSYKGGVGRSLALANLAYVLANRGRKVLIIDLDLEAPGQHKTDLFRDDFGDEITVPGMLDLLRAYRDHQQPSKREKDPRPPFEWDLRNYIRRSTITDTKTLSGSIWLMAAGRSVDETFQADLAGWDWENFYNECAGEAFLDALRWHLRSQDFDDVLIDSRTGLSDAFYVSTLSLADIVVCVSGLNHQNAEGTARAIETLTKPSTTRRYGYKRIIRVLSPVPRPFLDDADISGRKIALAKEWPLLSRWHVEIPYVPHLALDERVLATKADDLENSHNPYIQSILLLNSAIQGEDDDEITPELDTQINPFPAVRVEYWPPVEIAGHFVDPGGNILVALKQFMPTVLFGSRGTGKTICARYLSYDTTRFRLERNGLNPGPTTVDQIGLWFRLDLDLLYSFNTSEESLRPTYNRLFSQFLDILVLRKALDALEELGGIESWCEPAALFRTLARELDLELAAADIHSMNAGLESQLSEIRRYLNNPTRAELPFLTQANVLMKLLVEHLLNMGNFRRQHYFIVFIDEYENFRTYQQHVVNTRVKQVKESDRVTYKLLARNGGIHTYDTLADNQQIEATHDFRQYNLDEGGDYQDFEKHIIDILTNHIKDNRFFQRRSLSNPQDLFEILAPDEEARRIFNNKGRGNTPLKKFIEKTHGAGALENMAPWLDREPNPLRQTVAVVILNQGKSVEKVVQAFDSDDSIAKDWYHNYHMGALHWLVSLYSQSGKRYAGLNQIIGIAGHNTRIALDLCYFIIEQWLATDNKRALPISVEIQDKAIHLQSSIYLQQLSERGQERYKVHRFVERLGRLFENIHKSPRQGEPEINHFTIGDEPDEDTYRLLQYCRQEAILRRLPGNKQKSKSDAAKEAWQLNPCYAPSFNISWRRKKQMVLTASELHLLFFGKDEEWKKIANSKERHYSRIGKHKDKLKSGTDPQGRLL